MVRHSQGARRDVIVAPLIVTAELPGALQVWAERLRQTHYPAERNHVAAHVTLFQALPPSCEAELRGLLAARAAAHPPLPARIEGVMSFGRGTALKIVSPPMTTLREDLADRLRGLLTPQDQIGPRLHLTLQNKVSTSAARALRTELVATFQPRDFRFVGLALHRYRDGPWEFVKRWSFRG